MIYETLKKLSESQRKSASYIYFDEQTNQIKEIPLSKDMAGSALMKQYKNPAKEIRKFASSCLETRIFYFICRKINV